jgi:flagellar motor switch protein FliG
LESQGRIAKLSSDDLQAKLMQAFADNEELARKLREAEDALRDKVCENYIIGNKTLLTVLASSWLFNVTR